MACSDYQTAIEVYVRSTSGQKSSWFCSSQPTNVSYISRGRYLYVDGPYASGLYYQPKVKGNGGYKNINITPVGSYKLTDYLKQSMGQETSFGMAYVYVERATDLKTSTGRIRLYPGDVVYIGDTQGFCQGTGSLRSWIRCWGYKKGSGSITETFGGYILDPYSNSRSYRRLKTW